MCIYIYIHVCIYIYIYICMYIYIYIYRERERYVRAALGTEEHFSKRCAGQNGKTEGGKRNRTSGNSQTAKRKTAETDGTTMLRPQLLPAFRRVAREHTREHCACAGRGKKQVSRTPAVGPAQLSRYDYYDYYYCYHYYY